MMRGEHDVHYVCGRHACAGLQDVVFTVQGELQQAHTQVYRHKATFEFDGSLSKHILDGLFVKELRKEMQLA